MWLLVEVLNPVKSAKAAINFFKYFPIHTGFCKLGASLDASLQSEHTEYTTSFPSRYSRSPKRSYNCSSHHSSSFSPLKLTWNSRGVWKKVLKTPKLENWFRSNFRPTQTWLAKNEQGAFNCLVSSYFQVDIFDTKPSPLPLPILTRFFYTLILGKSRYECHLHFHLKINFDRVNLFHLLTSSLLTLSVP